MKSEVGGLKGSPLGELSAKLTERCLRLTKSSELKNDLSFFSKRFDESKDRKKSFSLLYLLCGIFLLCRGTARLAPCSFDFVKGRHLSDGFAASSPQGEPFNPPISVYIRCPPLLLRKYGENGQRQTLLPVSDKFYKKISSLP